MYRKNGLPWTKHLDFILLDVAVLVAAVLIAFYTVHPADAPRHIGGIYLDFLLTSLVVDFLVIILFNTMKNVLKRGYLIEFEYTLRNVALVFAIELIYIFGIHLSGAYSRLFFFVAALLYFLASYIIRIVYKDYLKKHVIPKRGRSLLIITDRSMLQGLNEQFKAHFFDVFHIAGVIVTDDNNVSDEKYEFNVIKIESAEDKKEYISDLIEWIKLNWIDEALILLPQDGVFKEFMEELVTMGITVHAGLAHFQDKLPMGYRELDRIGNYDVMTVYWNSISSVQSIIKRLVDIIAGLLGCAVTGVLVVLIGPLIYAASPGPIFFTQTRVGQNGKVFKLYKFRSMYTDAEERKKDLMDQNVMDGDLMFKMDFDPRVIGNKILPDGTKKTGIGDFIRRTSIDEFPQFFNILKNDMSLVGTRPPLVEEWEKYDSAHRARMAIKPGLTGLWQISGRNRITDFEEIVKLDKDYIANWSLRLDFKILLKTINVVLKRDGSM
jgi:exopolysaccharide biosynthesis polyprenyl glycosylphosphotransferase